MSRPHPPTGTNAERARLRNRQAVLGHIQMAGEMGRAEIARALGLSTQAVSNIISDLAAENLLVTRGTRSVGRGLPAMQYAVNPDGAYALGFEVRPDAVFAALLNLEGGVMFDRRVAVTDPRPDVVTTLIAELRDAALAAVPKAATCLLGAGIVMPGPFGQTGLSGQATDLPGWQAVDATQFFQTTLRMPVVVSNDANAAAMAERITGAAHGLSSYAYLYFGTGLGLGVVNQGHLIAGAFGNAGEIGHVPVPVSGGVAPLERCLSRMSLQQYLGAASIDFAGIQALHDTGDPALLGWLDQAAGALGYAVHVIENLFDPQTIILGGAMPAPVLHDIISRTALPVMSVAHRPDATDRLRVGATGRLTATCGAAALILNQTFTPHIMTVH